MRATVTSSWLPRSGSEPHQYEDAFYPRVNGSRHARRLWLAVADGASESMLAGRWADLLVRTWCRARDCGMPAVVAAAAAAWGHEVADYLEGRRHSHRPNLPDALVQDMRTIKTFIAVALMSALAAAMSAAPPLAVVH